MSKVLFVIKSLGMGGSTTSLMNMLELMCSLGHRVDLFVMEHNGIYFERARRSSTLLDENVELASAICAPTNIKKYGFRGLINRCFVSIRYKVLSPVSVKNNLYKKVGQQLEGYDVVVAYQESMTTHFARFIPAKKRIAWVHTIYERFTANASHNEMLDIYSSFDQIVCVAPAAVEAFQKGMPELSERVSMIPNPLNSEFIKEKAKLIPNNFPQYYGNTVVSVGRLVPEKQYDLAIHAAKKLTDSGIQYRWYIIGAGPEKEKLDALIKAEQLSANILLLGAMENPYSVIARSDVLLISSLYEAQPMVANEALILDVPVITTDYPSAKTLIKHGINGLICNTTVDGIYAALKEFFSNENLRVHLIQGAQMFEYDNAEIGKKVLTLCEV